MAKNQDIQHLGFSVPDVTTTRDLFVNVLDFRQVGEDPDSSAVVLSYDCMLLTLWQAVEPLQSSNSRINLGLCHLTLKVGSLESLHRIYSKLQVIDTPKIEFLPVPLSRGPVRYIVFAIPGGIRISILVSALDE